MGAVKVEVTREGDKKKELFVFGWKSGRKYNQLIREAGLLVQVEVDVLDDQGEPTGEKDMAWKTGPNFEAEWLDYQCLAAWWAGTNQEKTIDDLIELMDEISSEDIMKLNEGFFSHTASKNRIAAEMRKQLRENTQNLEETLKS